MHDSCGCVRRKELLNSALVMVHKMFVKDHLKEQSSIISPQPNNCCSMVDCVMSDNAYDISVFNIQRRPQNQRGPCLKQVHTRRFRRTDHCSGEDHRHAGRRSDGGVIESSHWNRAHEILHGTMEFGCELPLGCSPDYLSESILYAL